jgi:hypothetical protein
VLKEKDRRENKSPRQKALSNLDLMLTGRDERCASFGLRVLALECVSRILNGIGNSDPFVVQQI